MTIPLPDDRVFSAIRSAARTAGVRVYLVGGPLRDLLLGRTLHDIDVAVHGSPRRFGAQLAAKLRGTITFYAEFGTGTVFLPDGRHIDLARTRSETYAQPAALPEVRFTGIANDLKRRDFTINAMACDLASRELMEVPSGIEDLRNGVIRILHDRSFHDDPTRIFRAIRFSIRLGFLIEPATSRKVEEAVREGLLRRLSGTRVLNELRLVLREEKAVAMLRALNQRGVFASLFGRNTHSTGIDRLSRLSLADPYMRIIYMVSLLHDTTGLPMTHEQQADVAGLRAWPHLRPRLAAARTPSRIRSVLTYVPRNSLLVESLLETGPTADKIRRYLETYSHVEPLLTGRDLKMLGLVPGPIYGRILDQLLVHRLDRGALTREQELALVKRWTN